MGRMRIKRLFPRKCTEADAREKKTGMWPGNVGKSRFRQKIFLTAGFVFLTAGVCGCGPETSGEADAAQEESAAEQSDWLNAQTSPYGKYPELVTYTLGQMSGTNNSNLPEGDTYEDNAYTRYLREMLNIQNETVYSEPEDRYEQLTDVLARDQNLPDILVVDSREVLNELVENDLVEDLTEVYENCTSSRIKEMYESYGEELLEAGTFDGKLLALPETVIDHGPRLLWLRKDWMDELGLSEPETLEDAFDIIEAFQENGMGAEDGEEPVGLVCDTSLVGTTSSNYSVDPIFEMFGAHPQSWILGEDGEIVYGSLTENTKQALSYLHELYERGILDQNFALRAQNNLRDLVVEGKCGAFFGLWWSPNNPLIDAYEADPSADWQPYYLTDGTSDDTTVYNSFRDNKYVVVRKGYEHPEIVMKIVSVLFDYVRFEADDAGEVNDYFRLNVDPTARPLVINVDYNEATYTVTENIRRAMDGEIDRSNLSAIEQSYYDGCMNYLEGADATAEDWAAYQSRISAVGLIIDSGYTPPKRKYLAQSDGEMPQLLSDMETDAFIQIIMGEQPVDYFDTFVEEWYDAGGRELTEKIRQENQG